MIERSRVRIPVRAAGEFSSPGSNFFVDSYFGIRSTPSATAVARLDPGHSAKSAGGRLQINTHAPYRTRRDGSSFMWYQPCQRGKYITSVDIQKRQIKS